MHQTSQLRTGLVEFRFGERTLTFDRSRLRVNGNGGLLTIANRVEGRVNLGECKSLGVFSPHAHKLTYVLLVANIVESVVDVFRYVVHRPRLGDTVSYIQTDQTSAVSSY